MRIAWASNSSQNGKSERLLDKWADDLESGFWVLLIEFSSSTARISIVSLGFDMAGRLPLCRCWLVHVSLARIERGRQPNEAEYAALFLNARRERCYGHPTSSHGGFVELPVKNLMAITAFYLRLRSTLFSTVV